MTSLSARRAQGLSWIEILREALANSEKSIPTISNETGIAHPVLYRIKNGDRDNLRLDIAENLATHLGLSLASVVKK